MFNGNLIQNVHPLSKVLYTPISPFSAAIIFLQIVSPIPEPSIVELAASSRSKGLNIFSGGVAGKACQKMRTNRYINKQNGCIKSTKCRFSVYTFWDRRRIVWFFDKTFSGRSRRPLLFGIYGRGAQSTGPKNNALLLTLRCLRCTPSASVVWNPQGQASSENRVSPY